MTIRISFEDLENYLRSHPWIFSLTLFLGVSLTTRYIVFGLGLYHWASYVLLGALLGAGSIYFGLSWKRIVDGKLRVGHLTLMIASALLPLIAALFDQVYLQTILRFTEPVSTTFVNISTQAGWLLSPDGHAYLYRARHTGSDDLWFWTIASMLLLFSIGSAAGRRRNRNGFTPA